MKSERLQRTLEFLKSEAYTVADEWKESKKSELLDELNALVSAINAIEIWIFDKKISTLIDFV